MVNTSKIRIVNFLQTMVYFKKDVTAQVYSYPGCRIPVRRPQAQ